MGGMARTGRFIMKLLPPTSYNFSLEVSQDGTKWSMVMDGKATQNK